METPLMLEPREVARGIHALTAYLPLPGLGVLPVNAFVLQGAQPVLVDTGVAGLRQPFMETLRKVIDPGSLCWIWITHTDPDHVGNLAAVLAEAPNARVVTNFLGMGKMGLLQLPLESVYLMHPGQVLEAGDRRLVAVAPPCYDAPETMGLLETNDRALLSADCFGAVMETAAETAAAIAPDALQDGLTTWATVDAPWLAQVDATRFRAALNKLRDLQPAMVLGSHLPPATGMMDTLLTHLFEARNAAPFRGPDQAALEGMMAAAVG